MNKDGVIAVVTSLVHHPEAAPADLVEKREPHGGIHVKEGVGPGEVR
jgi:hypothetical protein